MKTVLLTAFEPFGGEILNPSLEVARAFENTSLGGAAIKTLVLPVERFRAIELALDRINTQEPDLVIMLGEGGRRFRVSPERVAINVDDFRIADNTGEQPVGEPILEGPPAAYFSTLPIYEIVQRLKEASIPAAISNSAGTYLCNRLFFSVMHFISEAKLSTRAGFIHLPYMHEQVIDKPVDFPSLSKATLIDAVGLAIETSLAS